MTLARHIRGVFAAALAVILAAQVGLAVYAWDSFEEKLTPELERKAEAIALTVAAKVGRALAAGIPFDALRGSEEYFAEIRRANPDVAFIALVGAEGGIAHLEGLPADAVAALIAETPRHEAGVAWRRLSNFDGEVRQVVSAPVSRPDAPPAVLHVGLNRAFLDAKIAEIHLDILVVLAISLMVAAEVMRYVLAANLLGPAREVEEQMERMAGGDYTATIGPHGMLRVLAEPLNAIVLSVHRSVADLMRRAGDRRDEVARVLGAGLAAAASSPRERPFRPVTRVRLLTFLFMFGEQLSRPFLPAFAQGLLPPGTAGASLWAGVPIAAFMLAAALSMPVLAPWSDRVGRRRSFLAGALVAAAGLAGAALCTGIADFVAWRVVTALGYALMFVAGQGFVIDNTGERDRAQGAATFVGAIMVSELCAPGIGGILADRIGERPVFAVGAAIMVLAALVGASALAGRGSGAAPPPAGARPPLLAAMRETRFVLLMLTAAVPAKLALTAFLFYLVPVGLGALGNSQAEIGRIAMLYAVPSVAAGALLARLADRTGCHGLMVGLGGLITGAGFLPVLFWPDERAMVIGVVALGLGQAMSISPQLAMATRICAEAVARHGAGSVLGVYRLIERLGAAAGPMIAGGLTAAFGPMEAAGLLGAAVFASAVAFSAAFLVLGVRPEDEIDLGAHSHRQVSS